MASYANDLRDFLKRQPPAPTNLGTSGPAPIESPVPKVSFPEGPTLRNAAPGGAPPVAGTSAPAMGSASNSWSSTAAKWLGKAAPYLTGALVAADVAGRVLSKSPMDVSRNDTLANFDTRGLSPADAFMFAPKTEASERDPRIAIRADMEQQRAGRAAERARAGVTPEPDPYGLRPVSAAPPAGPVAPLVQEFREPPTPLESGDQVITPRLTSLGNGYGVSGANTSGRAGYSQRSYYDPAGNVVASGLSSATGRGGFVGAPTDAEAERGQRARMEQDAAAGANAASMNRAASAMRDLRAAQVAEKDGYERPTGLSAALAPSAAPAQTDPFSLPGDSFQDTRGRQAEYQRLTEQAATGNRRQQRGALAALQGLHGIVTANQNASAADREREAAAATAGNERLKALLAQQERAVDNARADRSLRLQEAQYSATQEQNQFNRDHTAAQFDWQSREDRIKLGEGKQKEVGDVFKTFVDQNKGENPALLLDYGRSLLGKTSLVNDQPEMARRLRDGVPTLEDLLRLKAYRAKNEDYWFFPPTEQEVVGSFSRK